MVREAAVCQRHSGHRWPAGLYLLAFDLMPSLNHPGEVNPRVEFELRIDSHADVRTVTAIWYNNRYRGGTRDETRITGLGGSALPLLDSEATGAIVVFAFRCETEAEPPLCHVWVCDTAVEED